MPRRLTERQRNSKQARKIKARQQWQYSLWCKCRRCMLLIAMMVMVVVGYGFASGKAQQEIAALMDSTHKQIASAGLAIEHIHLSGRQRTGMAEVKSAIHYELGTSMLKVDLDELRERLEEIPTVKKAAASRQFPSSLYVHLKEREPVAVWQHKGELKLIDELGSVMSDLNLHQYRDLPLLVGKGAPEHVSEVLTLLSSNKRLASEVKSAIRISNRRWDIRLKQDITVKLPEEGVDQAWKKISSMHEEEQLLLRHIEAIDMRNKERMYISIRPLPGKNKHIIPTKDT